MLFMALKDRKPLPAREKMFYLKNYIAVEVCKAIEGYFHWDPGNENDGAWKVLQNRYGNLFVKTFRDKLMKWTEISTNDPLALWEFSNFLQSCAVAIPRVKGTILNNCGENHKLLKKWPEWIIRKWGWIVVDEMDSSDSYAEFTCFTEFLSRQARTASLLMITFKPVDDRIPES